MIHTQTNIQKSSHFCAATIVQFPSETKNLKCKCIFFGVCVCVCVAAVQCVLWCQTKHIGRWSRSMSPRRSCWIISPCIYMQILPPCCLSAATMELSKSLSHHREMDFIPRPRGRGWKPAWIHMSSSLPAAGCRLKTQTTRPPSCRKANSLDPLAFVQMSEKRTDLRN